MLLEKKTFGHSPCCSTASTSAPGAPASSGVTLKKAEVLKPGVEMTAPVWVATELLWTSHPPVPMVVVPTAPAAVAIR